MRLGVLPLTLLLGVLPLTLSLLVLPLTLLILLSQADTAGILPSAWQNKGG